MKHRLLLPALTTLIASGAACNLIFSDMWAGAPYLVGVSELTGDTGICARILLLNESRWGETNVDNTRQYRGFDVPADLASVSAHYVIYDGHLGHLRNVHSEGTLTSGHVPYGEVVSIEIPYDAGNSPEQLESPFFDLLISLSVTHESGDIENNVHQLGFENGRTRDLDAGELEDAEGFCGKEYRYRVRASYLASRVGRELYDSGLTDY